MLLYLNIGDEIMITVKDVEHVAKLARLELTEEEKEKFTKQLGDVLKHVDAMNEVDTSQVEPMAHAIDFVNVMRDDKVYYEQTKEELLKNAPDEEDLKTKDIKINTVQILTIDEATKSFITDTENNRYKITLSSKNEDIVAFLKAGDEVSISYIPSEDVNTIQKIERK